MTDDNHEFTTGNSPGDQPFESTVNDAVAFFEEAFTTDESSAAASTGGENHAC